MENNIKLSQIDVWIMVSDVYNVFSTKYFNIMANKHCKKNNVNL